MTAETTRSKVSYVGAPAIFALELGCKEIDSAFVGQCYLVGSALERADWRDIDVRFMMSDEDFSQLFPDVQHLSTGAWEFDPRWLLMTVSISERLSKLTGLPVDFQFQPRTFANDHHKKPRHALGLWMAKPERTE